MHVLSSPEWHDINMKLKKKLFFFLKSEESIQDTKKLQSNHLQNRNAIHVNKKHIWRRKTTTTTTSAQIIIIRESCNFCIILQQDKILVAKSCFSKFLWLFILPLLPLSPLRHSNTLAVAQFPQKAALNVKKIVDMHSMISNVHIHLLLYRSWRTATEQTPSQRGLDFPMYRNTITLEVHFISSLLTVQQQAEWQCVIRQTSWEPTDDQKIHHTFWPAPTIKS